MCAILLWKNYTKSLSFAQVDAYMDGPVTATFIEYEVSLSDRILRWSLHTYKIWLSPYNPTNSGSFGALCSSKPCDDHYPLHEPNWPVLVPNLRFTRSLV